MATDAYELGPELGGGEDEEGLDERSSERDVLLSLFSRRECTSDSILRRMCSMASMEAKDGGEACEGWVTGRDGVMSTSSSDQNVLAGEGKWPWNASLIWWKARECSSSSPRSS